MRAKPKSKRNAHELSRLVIVTNREPFNVVTQGKKKILEKTAGGLVSALEPAMQHYPGLWISAGPQDLDQLNNLEKLSKQLPYQWTPVHYPSELHDGFYQGFSNRVLWPLHHSMLGNVVQFQRSEWLDFSRVNDIFAQGTKKNVKTGDLVWVHDYQLSLVPKLLRETTTDIRIGFFLHIPFPSYDIFRTLPWAKEILEGMLGAGLIGFQIQEYAEHFFDCVEAILGIHCDRNKGQLIWERRTVSVRSIPIGIDTKRFYNLVETAQLRQESVQLKQNISTPYLIASVDRLDYTKGIYKRFQAIETFFKRYPHRLGEVSFIQLAVPTRLGIESYETLRGEIEHLVGHINGLYGKPGFTPVTYMFRSVSEQELATLYFTADIAMVTPLRDGMNLVAKEYVACHRNKNGVLVLSNLAGAAQQLTEAVLVNPYDVEGMADALEAALTMPKTEQERRMRLLNNKISYYDVYGWVNRFVEEALYAEY